MIGKTLGHYQISSQLGKGGMGEVYQAKDQRLGRDVAIKVLPEELKQRVPKYMIRDSRFEIKKIEDMISISNLAFQISN
jgi:serine/threonine protein kinase